MTNEAEMLARVISEGIHKAENKGHLANRLLCPVFSQELKDRLPKEAKTSKCRDCGVKIIFNPYSLQFCRKNHRKVCTLCGIKNYGKDMKPLTKEALQLGLK